MDIELKTFEDSVVDDRQLSPGVRLINFQPGDGYKYRVLFCDTPGVNDLSRDAKVIIRLDHRGSNEHSGMTIEGHDTLAWPYVLEKMGGSETSARGMTKLICGALDIVEIPDRS